jgi:DNA-binding MarR family transcriptional regulator
VSTVPDQPHEHLREDEPGPARAAVHPAMLGLTLDLGEDAEMAPSSPKFRFPFPLSTLLGRVQAIYVAEFDRRLAEAGMGDMSLSLGTNVMRHLHGDKGVRLGALVEMAGVTKQAISQQVSHLESHGYVLVETDPDDSRAKQVRLTDKGARSQRVSRPIFAALERDWQQRFGATEISDLRTALERILAGFDDTDVVPRTRRGGHRVGP